MHASVRAPKQGSTYNAGSLTMYAIRVAAAPSRAYANQRAPAASRAFRNARTVTAVRHDVMMSTVIDEPKTASNGQVATSNAATRPAALPKSRRPSKNTRTTDSSDMTSG